VEFYCQIVNKSKIVPEFSSDYEALSKIKNNTTYKIKIVKPRNVKFHRKYFALLNCYFDNQHTFLEMEDLREWVQMTAGFLKVVTTPTGTIYKAKSINFASMDEIAFSELYNKSMDVILKQLGCEQSELEEQILNFM